MTELKPCPFCGGEGKYHGSYVEDDVCEYVSCTRCNASTPLMYKKGESIEWWNRRPSPWHTGTPTEEGTYLIYTKDYPYLPYRIVCVIDGELMTNGMDNFSIVAWQKITPFTGAER